LKVCHHCGREVSLSSALGRIDSCAYCSADLKCCLNCRFFDPGANNQCREPQAEWCPEKSKANFCEYFEFRQTSALSAPGTGGAQSSEEKARSAFGLLFKSK
jgi:hypothetical protein